MRIYPVVSNVVKVELEDGTVFELYEGGQKGLDIKVLDGIMTASELNVKTLGFDEVWKGSSINLARYINS